MHTTGADCSLFHADSASSPLSSFPSFLSSSQSFPMTPTHELTESMALPERLRQRIPFSPPESASFSDARGYSPAAARFTSALSPPPPHLSFCVVNQRCLQASDTKLLFATTC